MLAANSDRQMCTIRDTRNGGGLCSTCNDAATCYYHASRGPALMCELFDNCSAVETRTQRDSPATLAGAPIAGSIAYSEAGRASGLCMNCENSATCVHPKPAGGVWHCEDYR